VNEGYRGRSVGLEVVKFVEVAVEKRREEERDSDQNS